jgi:hypothetical protein
MPALVELALWSAALSCLLGMAAGDMMLLGVGWTVAAGGGSLLLLESGGTDNLLLESGDALLLES